MQVKLLCALEDRVVRPVGSNDTIPIDVRIISATHRRLEERIAAGDRLVVDVQLVVIGERVANRDLEVAGVALLAVFALPAAGYAGYRQDFENEFLTKTWAGVQMEENLCISCHSSDKMKPEFREITEEWQESWHAQNNISCENCHGGDPTVGFESGNPQAAMNPAKGFVRPAHGKIAALCASCHSAKTASFTTIHEKHVTDKKLDCSNCHTFTKG